MAEIVLNVEVRERTGTGGARAARKAGQVPGVLYGGELGPVPISAELNAFRKSLYTGKLLGHLITLKYGEETQPVIARDVQFHPVSDVPVHFDLYRVDEHAPVKISIPVAFKNHDLSPGLKRGGALTIALHEVEILVPADHIPEELTLDLAGLDIGDTIRLSALTLPEGASTVASDKDISIATISASRAQVSDDAAAEGAEEA